MRTNDVAPLASPHSPLLASQDRIKQQADQAFWYVIVLALGLVFVVPFLWAV
jgi:hypothetical protein